MDLWFSVDVDLATEEWSHGLLQGPLGGHLIAAKDDDRISFHLSNLNDSLVTICYYTRGYQCDDCSMDLWFLVDLGSLWLSPFGSAFKLCGFKKS